MNESRFFEGGPMVNMIENVSYRNIPEPIEDEIKSELFELFRKVDGDVNVNGVLERSGKGMYKASLRANLNWGPVFVRAESRTPGQLQYFLRTAIDNQLEKLKNKHFTEIIHPPMNFPRKSVVESLSGNIFLKSMSESMMSGLIPFKRPEVLVVDDDPEALYPVGNALASMGCKALLLEDDNDAFRQIITSTPDIVVLDWNLKNLTGGDLIYKCIDFKSGLKLPMLSRTRIITYSGTPSEKILVPESSQFIHVDHWLKPMTYNEMVERFSDVLMELQEGGT